MGPACGSPQFPSSRSYSACVPLRRGVELGESGAKRGQFLVRELADGVFDLVDGAHDDNVSGSLELGQGFPSPWSLPPREESGSSRPVARASFGVGYREDRRGFPFDAVDQAVGETPQEHVPMNLVAAREHLRMRSDRLDCLVERRFESRRRLGAPIEIPAKGMLVLGLGLRMDLHLSHETDLQAADGPARGRLPRSPVEPRPTRPRPSAVGPRLAIRGRTATHAKGREWPITPQRVPVVPLQARPRLPGALLQSRVPSNALPGRLEGLGVRRRRSRVDIARRPNPLRDQGLRGGWCLPYGTIGLDNARVISNKRGRASHTSRRGRWSHNPIERSRDIPSRRSRPKGIHQLIA